MGGSAPKPENALDFRKIIAGVVVTVIGGVLLKVTSEGIEQWSAARAAATPTGVETEASTAQTGEQQSVPSPSRAPSPRVFDFAACPSRCDGTNASTSFPGGTEVIHSRWNYANVPAGSHYVRSWTMDGLEWVRYDCTWQGAPAGMDEIELREPMGFHSGTWVITISVDGKVLLSQSLVVEGNNTYWDPAGVFTICYEQ